jgi:hypothetical protein
MGSKDKSKTARLGQEVFVILTTGGKVERTMVGALEDNGYMFLNGLHSSWTHWFDFDQAVSAAEERVKEREAALRAELKALGRWRKYLLSEEYRADVFSPPYKVTNLGSDEDRKRTRYLKNVKVPERYLCPGCRVYTIITPGTRVRWKEVYRPHPHFVLETEVQTVYFSPDGVAHYRFATPFEVTEFFPSKDEAVKRLSNFSEPGVLEDVPFVSQDEEKQKLGEMDDIPF